MLVMDKAGKKYWNDLWSESEIPTAVNPHLPGLNNYVNRRLHEYFCEAFSGMETQVMRLIEIGCARSAWLPYFKKEFGFKVFGIDYSEIGCQQAVQILSQEGIEGEVMCADLFSPPENMLETFDVVISFGVAEHFQDTAACIAALSKFLKPGGKIITNIPNLVGLIGSVQKIVNRPVFDMHMSLDKYSLKKAHEASGLEVLSCDYFIVTNFGVCNLRGLPPRSIRWFLKKVFLSLLARFSMTVWFVESKVRLFKPKKVISPYINCLARKPSVPLLGDP